MNTPNGPTPFRAIVRSDSLSQLTLDGWRSLRTYGIAYVLDLRLPSETANDPPCHAWRPATIQMPILPELDSPHWRDFEAITESAPNAQLATARLYIEYLERFPASFRRVLEAVAQAPRGGIVIHCHGGKDRTGLLVILLLRLADVAIEDVAADYALSEARLRLQSTRWIAGAKSTRERRRRARVSASPAAAVEKVLSHLDAHYGGVAGYLSAAALDDAHVTALKQRLRPAGQRPDPPPEGHLA